MVDATSGQTEVREAVRQRYAAAAVGASQTTDSCCGDDGCGEAGGFYDASEIASIPSRSAEASLGCGNPVAVAELNPGETVLDLGSGGGIDVLLSAQRVGPTGFAYGVDMTDEMLDLARQNAVEAGVSNVEFLKGYIEEIPLPDESVDVAISNCVINLSADKMKVFAELHRVLRPGGRIGFTDIVADDHLSPDERLERGEWVGCIAGALSVTEFEQGLASVGFSEVSLTPTHDVADGMTSMIIRARK